MSLHGGGKQLIVWATRWVWILTRGAIYGSWSWGLRLKTFGSSGDGEFEDDES
jgi:hypothetical protein